MAHFSSFISDEDKFIVKVRELAGGRAVISFDGPDLVTLFFDSRESLHKALGLVSLAAENEGEQFGRFRAWAQRKLVRASSTQEVQA